MAMLMLFLVCIFQRWEILRLRSGWHFDFWSSLDSSTTILGGVGYAQDDSTNRLRSAAIAPGNMLHFPLPCGSMTCFWKVLKGFGLLVFYLHFDGLSELNTWVWVVGFFIVNDPLGVCCANEIFRLRSKWQYKQNSISDPVTILAPPSLVAASLGSNCFISWR